METSQPALRSWEIINGRITPEIFDPEYPRPVADLIVNEDGGVSFTVISDWTGPIGEWPLHLLINHEIIGSGTLEIPSEQGSRHFLHVSIQQVGSPGDVHDLGLVIGLQLDTRLLGQQTVKFAVS